MNKKIIIIFAAVVFLAAMHLRSTDLYRIRMAMSLYSTEDYEGALEYYKKIIRKRMTKRGASSRIDTSDIMPGVRGCYGKVISRKQAKIQALIQGGDIAPAQDEISRLEKTVRYLDVIIDSSVSAPEEVAEADKKFIGDADAALGFLYSSIFEKKKDFKNMLGLHRLFPQRRDLLVEFFLPRGYGISFDANSSAHFESYVDDLTREKNYKTTSGDLSLLYSSLGRLFDGNSRPDRAYECFVNAFVIDPDNVELKEIVSSPGLSRYPLYGYVSALMKERAGDFAGAESELESIVKKGAADENVYLKMSEFSIIKKDLQKSVALLQKGAALQKDPKATFYRISDLYRETGDRENSKKYLKMGIELETDQETALKYNGSIESGEVLTYYNSGAEVILSDTSGAVTDIIDDAPQPLNVLSPRGELIFNGIKKETELLIDLKNTYNIKWINLQSNLRDAGYSIPGIDIYYSSDGTDYKKAGSTPATGYIKPELKMIYMDINRDLRYLKLVLHPAAARVSVFYLLIFKG